MLDDKKKKTLPIQKSKISIMTDKGSLVRKDLLGSASKAGFSDEKESHSEPQQNTIEKTKENNTKGKEKKKCTTSKND